jgi:hypothetical protein
MKRTGLVRLNPMTGNAEVSTMTSFLWILHLLNEVLSLGYETGKPLLTAMKTHQLSLVHRPLFSLFSRSKE